MPSAMKPHVSYTFWGSVIIQVICNLQQIKSLKLDWTDLKRKTALFFFKGNELVYHHFYCFDAFLNYRRWIIDSIQYILNQKSEDSITALT